MHYAKEWLCTKSIWILFAHCSLPIFNLFPTTNLNLNFSSPLLGHGVVCDVINGLGARGDLVGVVVWDLELELLLEGHHDLHSIKRVQTQVFGEVTASANLTHTHTHKRK